MPETSRNLSAINPVRSNGAFGAMPPPLAERPECLRGNGVNRPTIADAIIIFILVIIIQVFLSLFICKPIHQETESPLVENSAYLFYLLLITHIIGILVPVYFYIRLKRFNLRESLTLNLLPITTLVKITVISIIFFVLLYLFSGLISPVLFRPYEEEIEAYRIFYTNMTMMSKGVKDIVFLVFGIGIIPALTEEVLFRGLILNGLKNSSISAGKSVILSGLLFGIIHSFPPQILMVSILGIFFGFLVVKTGSIISSIWAHLLNNFLVILLILIC
ncbi:MAG: type II CAAX endopeptidase family protein [Planctomycetota bacterium]|nr:type II CAAX endopeptidase family protein [Planctomycetota bacterium]MDI6787021.1 type II CAAX endopeptidase family protein [Planctomycetota bacterium]